MSHYFAVDYGKADRMLGDLRYESGSVSLGEFALNDPAETPKKRKAAKHRLDILERPSGKLLLLIHENLSRVECTAVATNIDSWNGILYLEY